ncbi:hypothetical protein L0B07_27995 [Raoultella ornithinolytica]|uniref:hypothetical protein n=1 Tax=Raoultella ornithinolytica TaxID=54291 RepID=UPI003369D37A
MKAIRQLTALSLMAGSILFIAQAYGIHASAEGQSSDKYFVCANNKTAVAVHRALCD